MSGNRFSFIVPTFNAENTIQQMMLSIVAQSYSNWNMIIIDDMSTDNTVHIIKNFITGLGIYDRVSLIQNTEKKWEVGNIIEGLNHVRDDDIICRIDGDDWLCDLDALAIINHRYESMNVDALWTAHRWSFSDYNISGPLPRNADPYVHPWVSSHLKTFRCNLIRDVSDENFRNEKGEYFKRIGDQALYLPVLYKSQGNWYYDPIVAYHYTINMSKETFQTEDAKFQLAEAEFLRGRGFIR